MKSERTYITLRLLVIGVNVVIEYGYQIAFVWSQLLCTDKFYITNYFVSGQPMSWSISEDV